LSQQPKKYILLKKLIDFINVVIDNKFFKPIAITIIVVAIFLQLQHYAGFFLDYYQQVKKQKSLTSPVKVNIVNDKFSLDLKEDQVIDYVIKNNDNLSKILSDLGATNSDANSIIEAIQKVKSNYPLTAGDAINITYTIVFDYSANNNQIQQDSQQKNSEKNKVEQKKSPQKNNKNTNNKNTNSKNTANKNSKEKISKKSQQKSEKPIAKTEVINSSETASNYIKRNIYISKIILPIGDQQQIIVEKTATGTYEAKIKEIKLTLYKMRYFGAIKNGLFADGVDSGISASSMMSMINLYAYDIDFQRDIHSGDKFEMLVETFFDENGKKVKDGAVLYSSIKLQSKQVETYAYKINDRIEYFDAKGNSVRKSLLRTPVNGARISSGFGMRRHPILGYSKMHKGVDFAASAGTPILAAGNGTIIYMGIKGGYGNYVQIKHNADYSTAYGHASKFNRKFTSGSKVKQGDVIAYVGSTGRSTGPHLHFELIYKGTQVNPSKVKATSGIKLVGKDLAKFEATKKDIDKYRNNTPNQYKHI